MQRLAADPSQLPASVDTLLAACAVVGSDWLAMVRHVDQVLPPTLLKHVPAGLRQDAPPAMVHALAAVHDAAQLLLRYRCVDIVCWCCERKDIMVQQQLDSSVYSQHRTAIAAYHAVHINRIAVGAVIPMLVQAMATPAAAPPTAQQLLRQVLSVAEGLGSLPPPSPVADPQAADSDLPSLRSEWFSLTAYLFSSACVLPPATLEQAIGGGGVVYQVNAMVNASWFVDSLQGKIDRYALCPRAFLVFPFFPLSYRHKQVYAHDRHSNPARPRRHPRPPMCRCGGPRPCCCPQHGGPRAGAAHAGPLRRSRGTLPSCRATRGRGTGHGRARYPHTRRTAALFCHTRRALDTPIGAWFAFPGLPNSAVNNSTPRHPPSHPGA